MHSLTIEQIEVQVKILTQKTCRNITHEAKGHSRKLQYDFTSEQLPKYADAAESFLQNWFYFSNVHFFAQTKKISSSQDVAGSEWTAQTFTFHAPAGHSNDTARRKV